MARYHITAVLLAGTLLSLHSRIGAAQTTSLCTYDRCALRLESSNPMLPARLVQGVEGRPIATVGLFAGRIPLLDASADSIRIPYESFRSRQRTSNVLAVLTVATLVAAFPLAGHSAHGPNSGAWWALGAGVTLGVGTLATEAGAVSKLDEAIARYNDQLPDRR